MKSAPPAAFHVGRTVRLIALPAVALNLAVLWLLRDQLSRSAVHWHAPDLGRLAHAGFVIQLHLAAAVSALLVALLLLSKAKGTVFHRTVGWAWVILMMTTALSSFFIRTLNPGHLSWIHILSGWVAFATPLGVFAARTRRIRMHQRLMVGLVIGGLVIAGAFAFIPGRLLFQVFFG